MGLRLNKYEDNGKIMENYEKNQLWSFSRACFGIVFFHMNDTRKRLGHAHVSNNQLFIQLDIVKMIKKRFNIFKKCKHGLEKQLLVIFQYTIINTPKNSYLN